MRALLSGVRPAIRRDKTFMMHRWLARLSFSFFAIAMVLLWELYTAMSGRRGPVAEGRIALYMIACAMAVVLGVLGVRARHAPDRRD